MKRLVGVGVACRGAFMDLVFVPEGVEMALVVRAAGVARRSGR